jgi:hypothetical protein
MKNIMILAAAAMIGTAAMAETTGISSYDYLVKAGDNKASIQEAKLGLAQDTSVGKFDGVLILNEYRLGTRDDTIGFEVGYSNGLPLQYGLLTGRVAYGRKDQVANKGSFAVDNVQYYSLGAQFVAPVVTDVQVVIGYDYNRSFGSGSAKYIADKYTVGVNYAVTKDVTVNGAYVRELFSGDAYNGVSLGLSYKF